MKKLLTLYTTLLALCLLLLSCFASCDDDFVEYYNRWDITPCTGGTNTTSNSATLRGYIQCNGVWSGAISTVPVDECYFMLFSFSNGNSTRIDIPAPSLDEEFAAQVTGLTPGYYRYTLCVRYGELIAESSPESFTISLDAPILSDLQYTDLTATSVTLSGSVLDDGGGQLEALELHWRDFYYGSENEVELSPDSYTFTYTLSNLQPNTTYVFFARASNRDYSIDSERLTLTTLPAFSEFAVTAVESNYVTFRVVMEGSAALIRKGICYCVVNGGDSRLPTYENDACKSLSITENVFSSTIYDLLPLQTYCFRAYAANNGGMIYSDPITVTMPYPLY